MKESYPKPISNWEGLPNSIDDALQYSNGYTYFFKVRRERERIRLITLSFVYLGVVWVNVGIFFKMYGFIDYVLLFCVFPVFLYYSYNADEDQK